MISTLLFNRIPFLYCLHIGKPGVQGASGSAGSPREFLQKYAFSYHLLYKFSKNEGSVCQKIYLFIMLVLVRQTPELVISVMQFQGLVAHQVPKAVSFNSGIWSTSALSEQKPVLSVGKPTPGRRHYLTKVCFMFKL